MYVDICLRETRYGRSYFVLHKELETVASHFDRVHLISDFSCRSGARDGLVA